MSSNKPVPRSKLLLRTLALLRERPRDLTLEQIAKDTGLKRTWLVYFLQTGESVSASVDRIEALYEYLTKSTLAV